MIEVLVDAMRTLSTTVLTLVMAASFAMTQTSETRSYWITLRDLKPQISSQLLDIAERALKRRAKTLPSNYLIDKLDLPVSGAASARILQTGAKIRTVSRWFNAISVDATPQQLRALVALPDVAEVEPVARMKRTMPLPTLITRSQVLHKSTDAHGIDYGYSATQLSNIKVVDLHAVGVNGTGVLIGMLDDGFNNYRTHVALKNIKVVADSDFIHNISDVNRQPWEDKQQGEHGAGTLSAVGGFDNGSLIGSAFGASFILAKTEMDSSGNSADFHSEEDTFVAALEWMERLGVDITSSSLGYKEFLSPPFYTTADMNGKTTKVAQAAEIAARKGVLVVTAMGNEGSISGTGSQALHVDTTLWSPADADSIVAVGATSSDGELAAFSGCGPTADGRIKPEVVAQGLGVIWADGSSIDNYVQVNGTSCSTPLVAGAAALILSAHPEVNNMQVRQALLNTAVQIDDGTVQTTIYPNNYYGYGFVDAYAAALYLGPVFSNVPIVTAVDSQLIISTFIVSKSGILNDSVFFYYRNNEGTFDRVHLYATTTLHEYTCAIPRFLNSTSITGYFSIYDSVGQNYTTQLTFNPPPIKPSQFTLFQNYPNPFNSGTIISFESPTEENIEVVVYNILGQRIKTLLQGRTQVGTTTTRWDGTDEHGRHVATGMYIARLKTPNFVSSKKMLLLK